MKTLFLLISSSLSLFAEIPSWVQPVEPSSLEAPVKPSQINYQFLLIDCQRNFEEKTAFTHYTIKVLTKKGIEDVSSLEITYDPTYSKVEMQTLRVYRDGQWTDRLESSPHKLIQREDGLENNLFDGDLTLVYFLEDIREGDIIDYAYTLTGAHPHFGNQLTELLWLQDQQSLEKLSYRLLADPKLNLQFKSDIEPTVRDLTSELREWKLEALETTPLSYESNEPVWHRLPQALQISQFSNWHEVAQNLLPLYELPSDFAPSPEMISLVESWRGTPKERALMAVRFVQDEVRYGGFAEGMKGIQPVNPVGTFQNRYGDCKNKTFLLHALLKMMDIESNAVLVQTKQGKRLNESLPTPSIFDHCILQMTLDGNIYFIDPTYSLQGGTLDANFFPDYGWGLTISSDTHDLVKFPANIAKNPNEIETSINLTNEDTAKITLKWTFRDKRADHLRRSLAWDGIQKVQEADLNNLQKVYGEVTSDAPATITDDRENNILTTTETYTVRTDGKTLDLFSCINKYYLLKQPNPQRTAPLAIDYPLWVKETIHIENPKGTWKPSQSNYTQEHESLAYSLKTQFTEQTADLNIELKHEKDHVPQESMRDFWYMLKDINRKTPKDVEI